MGEYWKHLVSGLKIDKGYITLKMIQEIPFIYMIIISFRYKWVCIWQHLSLQWGLWKHTGKLQM